MSTLVDPHICPDCRAPLDAAGTCLGCGLRLVGPLAAELWQRMNEADRLVEQLRAASAAASPAVSTPGPPVGAESPAAPLPVTTSAAPASAAPTPSRAARLPAASVPVVLLALGGLCLLVAAIVFVAVAWGSLGLVAKTAILLVVTGLLAVGAVMVTRRSLRFAAETLWLVVSALVAVDLAAAHGADLFGLRRLSDRDAVGLVGAALLGLAVAAGAWATTTSLQRLHGAAAVAGVGVALFAGAEAWTSDHNPTVVAVSVPVLAVVAWAIDRVSDGRLRAVAGTVGAAALVSWLVLVEYGPQRMASTATDGAWWSDLRGWPLLAAAAMAVAVTLVSRLSEWIRMPAAGAALLCAALAAAGPGTSATADLLTWAGISAAVAAICALAPMVWSRPAAVLTVVSLITWSVAALVRPFDVITQLPTTAPPDRANLAVHLPASPHAAAAWTAIVSVRVVGAAASGLLRHVPWPGVRGAAGRAFIALGPAVLALGATTGLDETRPTLVAAVLAWAGTLALAGAMTATVRHDPAALGVSLVFVAYLLAAGLRTAAASHLLVALLATVVALAVAVAYARAERRLLVGALLSVLGAAAVLLAGLAATHWPYLLGGRGDAAGASLAGVAAVALLLAQPVRRDEPSRVTIEVAALLIGLVATAFPNDHEVVAMILTVLGTAVALVSVLNRDRDQVAWLGVVLLGVATLVRVANDVRAPEAYTLPAAALLLVAGWWRLRADPAVGSPRALSSGLALGLVPSLLLTLDDPISTRGALVAAAGLAALAVGVARLWSAPFLAGALTTGVLAVRHLGPVVDALPRWISLGSIGVLLLLVGVSWEQRRRNLTAAGRYLGTLR